MQSLMYTMCRIYWIGRYNPDITLKDAPSSSSSIRLLFTQIDDKDETDDTIKSMMLHLIRWHDDDDDSIQWRWWFDGVGDDGGSVMAVFCNNSKQL